MKFIIRDDDVNAMYPADQLKKWYDGIYEICPISICAVPFIKGDYFKWVRLAVDNKEESLARKNEFYDDDEIHKIDDNKPLIEIIKKWRSEGKVSVSLHGIHHRNWDRNAKDIKDNYSTGAEFWTDRDLTEPLIMAKKYLSDVIGTEIKAFASPQNLISYQSYKALRNAHLNVNCTFYLRNVNECLDRFGLIGYIKQIYLRVFKYGRLYRYPYIIRHNGFNILTNYGGLYPGGVTLETIKKQIDFVNSKNGIYVLSTHSFGFDDLLPQCGNITVKEAIMEIVQYTKSLPNVEYTTLEEVFS